MKSCLDMIERTPCGLYFLAAIFAAAIVTPSHHLILESFFCGGYCYTIASSYLGVIFLRRLLLHHRIILSWSHFFAAASHSSYLGVIFLRRLLLHHRIILSWSHFFAAAIVTPSHHLILESFFCGGYCYTIASSYLGVIFLRRLLLHHRIILSWSHFFAAAIVTPSHHLILESFFCGGYCYTIASSYLGVIFLRRLLLHHRIILSWSHFFAAAIVTPSHHLILESFNIIFF